MQRPAHRNAGMLSVVTRSSNRTPLALCSSMYRRFQQAVKKKLYSILSRSNEMRMARTNGGSENGMIIVKFCENAEQSNRVPLLQDVDCGDF